MTHTSIVDRYPADIASLARGYTPAKQGFDIDESAWEQVGDGQVHTTVGDSAAVDRQLPQRTRRRARAREAHDRSRRAQVG